VHGADDRAGRVPARPYRARHRSAAWGGVVGVLAVIAAVLVGCTSTGSQGPVPAGAGPLRSQLVEGATGAGAMTHVEALQQIADRNGGNRASPGPGYDASVDYVAGVLRNAGFDVTTPTFRFRQRGEESVIRNVVAQTRTGSPDRVVMAGAHLDSVTEGPGINDNASGVATLLEIATRMGGSPQVTNALRFGFWGAEEEDLNGSTSYVGSLSEQDRGAIALYLNLDMLASPNAGYFVQGGASGRGSRSGPPGSAAVGRVLMEEMAATGVTAELFPFEGDSDYAPFVDADIPAGGVLAGDAGTKTSEQAQAWGGQAGQDFDRCYHSPCDRVDTLDQAALDDFTDAIAGTLARFATSTEVPAR
jgi:aminopeptidase S